MRESRASVYSLYFNVLIMDCWCRCEQRWVLKSYWHIHWKVFVSMFRDGVLSNKATIRVAALTCSRMSAGSFPFLPAGFT